VGVGPGYPDPFRGVPRSASGTNSLELEKSGFKRVRSDIEVGPEGLLTANMPDKGSAGIVALGISGGRSQVARMEWQLGRVAFGQLVASTNSPRGVGIIAASEETISRAV